MSELARFFLVTVLGVILDIGIAYALAEWIGWPLWFAALIGFIVAACFNYVVHQTWSFQSGSRQLSAHRAARYGIVAVMTLVVRLAVIALLDAFLPMGFTLAILICGAGVSFFVNFGLSKWFAFGEAGSGQDAP